MDQRTKTDLEQLVSDLKRLLSDVSYAYPDKSKAVADALSKISAEIQAAISAEPAEAAKWKAFGKDLIRQTIKLAKQYGVKKENNPQ
jgi:gas vesicle protein